MERSVPPLALYVMNWAHREKLSTIAISLYRKVGFKPVK